MTSCEIPRRDTHNPKAGETPILIEEIGHSTGQPGQTEEEQADRFREWLNIVEQEDIAGLLQWSLCDWHDAWAGDEVERRYGFLRADGCYSRKLAADVYRNAFRVRQDWLVEDR